LNPHRGPIGLPFHDVVAGSFPNIGKAEPLVEVPGGIVAQDPKAQGEPLRLGFCQGTTDQEFSQSVVSETGMDVKLSQEEVALGAAALDQVEAGQLLAGLQDSALTGGKISFEGPIVPGKKGFGIEA
jgi:hypothetical protein